MRAEGPGKDTYVDAGSVAPLHPAAEDALDVALRVAWADPRRRHSPGRRAREVLEEALEQLATGLGARADEIVLTSGLSQSLQWAVSGVRAARHRVGSRVVVSAVEHSSLLKAAASDSCVVPVDAVGRPEGDAWSHALTEPGVILQGLQLANHEIGTIQHLPSPSDVPLLSDVSAAALHLDIARRAAPAALLCASPALWGAPAGLGLLVVRTGTRWIRPTPKDEDLIPVPLVAAASASLSAVVAERDRETARILTLTQQLRGGLAAVPDLVFHGDPDDQLPGLVAVSVLYVDAEVLVDRLDRVGIAVHSGSSCTSDTLEPSHVLVAIGALTQGNLRITLHRDSTPEDVERLISEIPRAIEAIRIQTGVVGL